MSVKLDKFLCYALRHSPDEFNLEMDNDGWVKIDNLLTSLKSTKYKVTKDDLKKTIENSDKRRLEMNDHSIRALYGHSVLVNKENVVPPEILYHGTTPNSAELILKDGLHPMLRQYVHHADNIETALNVGGRRCAKPVALTVYAKEAYESGIKFYLGNEDVWMSEYVPARFIKNV